MDDRVIQHRLTGSSVWMTREAVRDRSSRPVCREQQQTIELTEEAVSDTIRAHWEKQALRMFTRARLTRNGYQALINLDSHVWCKETKKFIRVQFPGGTYMPLHVSYGEIIKSSNKIAEDLGLKFDHQKAMFNVRAALVKRLEALDNLNLLQEWWGQEDTLLVQLLADAACKFSAKQTKGTCIVFKPIFNEDGAEETVNSIANQVLLGLYAKDDDYESMLANAQSVRAEVYDIMLNGVYVNGKHWHVKVVLGGDLKLLASLMGLSGGSSLCSCIYCETSRKKFHMVRKDLEMDMVLRTLERLMKLAHVPLPGEEYPCPGEGCSRKVGPEDHDKVPDSSAMSDPRRQAEQKKHFAVVPGRESYLPLEPHVVMGLVLLDLGTVTVVITTELLDNVMPSANVSSTREASHGGTRNT